jgi:hypothetical protein
MYTLYTVLFADTVLPVATDAMLLLPVTTAASYCCYQLLLLPATATVATASYTHCGHLHINLCLLVAVNLNAVNANAINIVNTTNNVNTVKIEANVLIACALEHEHLHY